MTQDKTNKTLNVPPLRFPGFTDEWKKTTLGEIAISISAGKSGNPNEDGKYDLYGSTGKIGRTNNGDYEGEKILVARVGANAGKINYNDVKCGITDNTLIVQPNGVSTKYIYYHLIHSNLNRLVFGSGQPLITGGMLKKLILNVPSIPESERIVKLLESIDLRITTQHKIIDNLQSLIKGLAKTHYNSCPTLDSVKIKELGEPYTVMNLSKEQLSDSGLPCILYGELFTQYGPVIEDVISKTNLTGKLTLSKGSDLLFPSSTTVDALSLIAPSALTKTNIILGGDMFGIKVSDDYSPEYLSLYFNYIGQRDLAKYAIGSTIVHLHYKDIAEHIIRIPSIGEQQRFVKLASFVKRKIDIEQKLLHNLITLKFHLLQELFI
ncbi:MAG: hypothetical protein HDS26_04750 [Bacteroides sp.]|nr:hypothetical protein [Bacteroides sp.]